MAPMASSPHRYLPSLAPSNVGQPGRHQAECTSKEATRTGGQLLSRFRAGQLLAAFVDAFTRMCPLAEACQVVRHTA